MVPHGGDFQGKQGVGEFFAGLGANWQALARDIEAVAEVGSDLVMGVLRADGVRTDGAKQSYGAAHGFTMRDGKIARFCEYVDADTALV